MRDKKIRIIGVLSALLIVLVSILVLISSNNGTDIRQASQSDDSTTLSLISPSGAPALSLAGVINNDSISFDYEIVDGSDVLSAAFMSAETDLIIAPINLGLNLMENGANYTLLGVVSWGNLYVVGTSTYGTIAAFGQSSVPGTVLEYVQSQFTNAYTIDYYSSVTEVFQLLSQGEYSGALLSEPYVTSVLAANDSFSIIYDLQELYADITGYESYPQAAIFVNNDSILSKTRAITELCNMIDMTISSYNTDASALLSLDIDFTELGFSDVELLIEAYADIALDFEYASDVVDELNEFLELFDIVLTETMYVR